MILERMTVSSFRKLAAPFTFIPSESFTVIHAPTVLGELSRKRLQVIVTTADRSRYLGIAGAKHADLAAELFSESAA